MYKPKKKRGKKNADWQRRCCCCCCCNKMGHTRYRQGKGVGSRELAAGSRSTMAKAKHFKRKFRQKSAPINEATTSSSSLDETHKREAQDTSSAREE